MLGYVAPNNDVYIFLESDDILKLKGERVSGKFVNIREPRILGRLEAIVDDKSNLTIMEKVGMDVKKDDDGLVISMSVALRNEIYERMLDKKYVCLHQGYRKFSLLDANHLDFHASVNYDLLKTYVL